MKYLLMMMAFVAGLAAILPAAAQRDNRDNRDNRADSGPHHVQIAIADIPLAKLPPEAREVLRQIDKGPPYQFERDGIVFGNFEKRLPVRERGYYHEFTVKTPGVSHRGARRLISGRGGERYYSGDHYTTFKRVVP